MKIVSVLSLCLAFFGSTAEAKLVSKMVEYKDGDQVLEGYLSYDNKGKNRPVVIVVHEWMGLTDSVKKRADRVAKEGYVVFAADIYGKGNLPKDKKEASTLSGKFKSDRQLLQRRIQLALETAKQQPKVDTNKVAAIGYCFGGTTVLELARSGADIDGVVSFHGGLSTPTPAQTIIPKVLVLHGAEDPGVPAKEVAAFEEEMRKAKANWELTKYSGAVHSFTNPEAGNDPSTGNAYNEQADKRSWIAMNNFLKEVFR